MYEMFPFIVSGRVLSIYRLKDAYSEPIFKIPSIGNARGLF